MKKLIAIILTVLTLSSLSITALAAGTTGETGTEDAVISATNTAGTENAAPAAEQTAITAALTDKQALTAALKDAGEKEADVTVTKNSLSEKETQDGGKVAVYTVKFNTSTTNYKYVLDADSGAVLRKEVVFQSSDVVFKHKGRDGSHGEAGGRKHGKGSGKTKGQNTDGTSESSGSGTGTT